MQNQAETVLETVSASKTHETVSDQNRENAMKKVGGGDWPFDFIV